MSNQGWKGPTEELLVAILTSAALVVLFLEVFATKTFSRILWLLLFCYPHGLTENLMPMNAGMDDLYIIVLASVLLFKRIREGKAVFGFGSAAALSFLIVSSVSEFTGALTGPEFLMEKALKAFLKAWVYVSFGFIMDNSMDDLSDVDKMLKWFLLAGIGGALTAIGQVAYEPMFRVFSLETPEAWQMQSIRGGGAFLNPNAAGTMILVFLMLCLTRLRSGMSFVQKPLMVAAIFFFLIAIVLTRSRSAWAGLAFSGLLLAIFSPLRRYVFLTGVIAVAGYLASSGAQTVILERILMAESSAVSRIEIWKTFIENPTIYMLLCGRGSAAEYTRLNATPHNTYIHIVYGLGLVGALWAVWFLWRLFGSCRHLIQGSDMYSQSVGNWVLYSLAGLAVCGLALELLFNSFLIYTLIFMAAAVNRLKRLKEERSVIDQQATIQVV